MSDTGYPVPARAHRVEETIQRSRFLTTLARAETDIQARSAVLAIREEFPDATHHCFAFVAGPPGSTAAVGMSDDGEPHGTAGRPMLTALLHSGVGEVVAVCTRWYGGTKLGTGGLGRAYSGGVRLALEDLPTVQRVERARVEVEVGYPQVDGLQRLLAELDGRVDREGYAARVVYEVAVPEVWLARLQRGVADLTAGEGNVRRIEGG